MIGRRSRAFAEIGRGAVWCALLTASMAARVPAAESAALPARPGTAPAASGAEPEVIRLRPAPDSGSEESQAAAVPATTQGVNAREVLSSLWFRYQALRQRGAEREAAALVDSATAFMQREGLRAAPEIGAAFLAAGRRAERDGDLTLAREDTLLALRFDPGRADAEFALAALQLRGGHDLRAGFAALGAGLRTLGSDPESLFDIGGAAAVVLYLGLLWGSVTALALLGFASRPALSHQLEEMWGRRPGDASALLLAGGLLAAPLLMPFPLPCVAAVWGLVLFWYAGAGGRTLVVAALVIFSIAGVFGGWVGWHLDTATDPAARALLQAARDGPDLRQEAALKAAVEQHPSDPVYPFLLASAYRIGGRFDEAMTMYRRILDADPRNARALVNLGNLHSLRQEFAQAQTYYKKAADADPTLALAHYDSHLAHLETFSMEDADAELRRARQVDDALVTRILAATGEGSARRTPLDAGYPPRDIWRRALQVKGRPGGFAMSALTNAVSLAGLAGLAALIVLPLLRLVPRSGRASTCQRCGRTFCRRCQMPTRYPGTCSQCVHLFVLRDGLPPLVRDRKMAEVVRHRRGVFWMTRVTGLVLPGAGHVLGGRPLLGAALLGLWEAAWIGWFLRGRLLVPPSLAHAPALAAGTAGLALVALCAWLVANLTRPEAIA